MHHRSVPETDRFNTRPGPIATWLARMFPVDEGERLPVIVLFSHLFLVSAAVIGGKAARDAFFLSQYGKSILPLMYLLNAVARSGQRTRSSGRRRDPPRPSERSKVSPSEARSGRLCSKGQKTVLSSMALGSDRRRRSAQRDSPALHDPRSRPCRASRAEHPSRLRGPAFPSRRADSIAGQRPTIHAAGGARAPRSSSASPRR